MGIRFRGTVIGLAVNVVTLTAKLRLTAPQPMSTAPAPPIGYQDIFIKQALG